MWGNTLSFKGPSTALGKDSHLSPIQPLTRCRKQCRLSSKARSHLSSLLSQQLSASFTSDTLRRASTLSMRGAWFVSSLFASCWCVCVFVAWTLEPGRRSCEDSHSWVSSQGSVLPIIDRYIHLQDHIHSRELWTPCPNAKDA